MVPRSATSAAADWAVPIDLLPWLKPGGSRSVSSISHLPLGWLALRRPGNPEVSTPCQRQPGAEDHFSSVHVGVGLEAAGHATESRLALARLRGDVPAGRTGLRPKRGGDGHNVATILAAMPLQGGAQCAPGFVQDGAVEARLLSNVAPRLLNRPPRRSHHVGHAQVLDSNQAMRGRQFVRPLVPKVSAPEARTAVHAAHRAHGRPTTIRALLLPRQALVEPSEVFLLARWHADEGEVLAAAGGQRHNHTAIDAHRWQTVRHCLDTSIIDTERDEPGVAIALHSGMPERTADWTGPAKPNAPQLRQSHLAPSTAQPTHLAECPRLWDSERWLPSASRSPVDAKHAVLSARVVQISQGLDQSMCWCVRQPRFGALESWQLSALGSDSDMAMSETPCRPPLLQCHIPESPARGPNALDIQLLRGGEE